LPSAKGNNNKLLALAGIVGKLKQLKRTGWVMFNVSEPESVAEHSFSLAMLALTVAKDYGLDEAKVVKMALLHDLGEAIIGDVVTQRRSRILPNQAAKQQRELAAMRQIAGNAGHESDWTSIFEEFVAGATPEARLVQDLDRLDAAIQATEYHDRFGLDPSEWIENSRARIHDPRLLELLELLRRQ
jgi:putative hydrolase of HD superfamily